MKKEYIHPESTQIVLNTEKSILDASDLVPAALSLSSGEDLTVDPEVNPW